MDKFIVERADGTTDRVEADYFEFDNGVIIFYEDKLKKLIRAYPFQSVVCVMPYVECEESEEPSRRKNDNDDLISRSALLNFLRNHWSVNVIEVIQTFEKAEYLD